MQYCIVSCMTLVLFFCHSLVIAFVCPVARRQNNVWKDLQSGGRIHLLDFLSPCVNFTNTLRAASATIFLQQKSTSLKWKYGKACARLLYKKAVRKMLVKLTACLLYSQFKNYVSYYLLTNMHFGVYLKFSFYFWCNVTIIFFIILIVLLINFYRSKKRCPDYIQISENWEHWT